MDGLIYLCKDLTLNIKVIEAKDVPAMDRGGTSDPYLKLYLLGSKSNEKIGEVKTDIIKKTLNPVWNENFNFQIKSIGTDVLHMSFKDWNALGDDPISTYDLQIRNLILGKVYDEWISFIPVKGVQKGGLIHLKYHLAPPGTYAYVDNPTETKTFNIKIIEAKEVKSMDLNGFSDPFCQMQIIGDRTFSKTSVKNKTLSPYWDESFSFIITNYDTDIFKLNLMSKDTISDTNIGSINLQINQYEVGKVYKKWVEVQHKGKKTGLVSIVINVNKTGEEPFKGELIEEKKNFVLSEKWQINIHLLKSKNLPSADSNGLSDPYCILSIVNTKFSIKSRRIDKCLNPIWDEYFQIPINSLNSDILRLEIIDWNKITKHSKLCMRDFPLSNYEFGKVYSDTYSLTPLEKRPGGSTVELTFQITPPFLKPFTEMLYVPDQLNVKLEEITGIITKKKLKEPKLYFNMKLENDSNEGIRSSIKEELNGEIKEEFNFIITDLSTDKLIIEYKNEKDKNKTISKCIIPLNDLNFGLNKKCTIPMEPRGLLHLCLKLEKKESKKIENNYNNIIKDIISKQEKKENEKLPSLNDIIDAKSDFVIDEKNINLFEENKSKDEKNTEDNLSLVENTNLENVEDQNDKNEIKEINKEGNQLLSLEEIITEKNDSKKEEFSEKDHINEIEKEKEKEELVEKDKIETNKLLNETLQTNEGNANLVKTNKKDLISEEKKTNINTPKKQMDDVKIMINNPIIDDNNIYQKKTLEYPYDNLKEIKCCPDCNIF